MSNLAIFIVGAWAGACVGIAVMCMLIVGKASE